MVRWLVVVLLVSSCVAQESASAKPDYPTQSETLLALDIVDKAFASYETLLNGFKDDTGGNIVQHIEGKASFDKDADAVRTGGHLIAVLKADPSRIDSYSMVGILTIADDVTLDASTTVTMAAMTTCVEGATVKNTTVTTAMSAHISSLRDASEELMHVTLRYLAADRALMQRVMQILDSSPKK